VLQGESALGIHFNELQSPRSAEGAEAMAGYGL
jgi:hypothetical protein